MLQLVPHLPCTQATQMKTRNVGVCTVHHMFLAWLCLGWEGSIRQRSMQRSQENVIKSSIRSNEFGLSLKCRLNWFSILSIYRKQHRCCCCGWLDGGQMLDSCQTWRQDKKTADLSPMIHRSHYYYNNMKSSYRSDGVVVVGLTTVGMLSAACTDANIAAVAAEMDTTSSCFDMLQDVFLLCVEEKKLGEGTS